MKKNTDFPFYFAIVLIIVLIIISGFNLYNIAFNPNYIVKFEKTTSFDDYINITSNYEKYYGISLKNELKIDGVYYLDDYMQKEASNLKSNTVEATVNNVMNYVDSRIEYNYADNGSRNYGDAITPFYSKVGVCEDYSRLAVAFLRYNGIYSKYVEGAVNETSRHAWVEVLYPIRNNGLIWNPIDPQNNKFPEAYLETKDVLAKDIKDIQVFVKQGTGYRLKEVIKVEKISFVTVNGSLSILI